jgi:hypothetical protein
MAQGGPRPDRHGLWLGDSRFLSEYHLLIDGREPEPMSNRVEAGSVTLELAAGDLQVRSERYFDAALGERITITNPEPSRAVAELELVFDGPPHRLRSGARPGQGGPTAQGSHGRVGLAADRRLMGDASTGRSVQE